MEDNSDVDSDGSDIDIGNFDENDNANDDFELREVNRNADEWLEAMFDSDSDNDMEIEGFQEDWTQNNFVSRLPSRFKLIGGATVQHPEEAEAHHYYELLWCDDLWKKLVDETNRYAEQECRKNPPQPKAPKWTLIDVPTMKAFKGLCFAMGILRLPSRHNY